MSIKEVVNNYSINQYLSYVKNGKAGNEPIDEFLPVSIFEKIVNTISTPVDEGDSLAEYSSYITSDTTSGPVTINLDPAAQYVVGRQYTFVNTGTNDLTIDANGSETINGELTLVIDGQYEQSTIYTDGTEWFIATSTSGSYSLDEVTSVGNSTTNDIIINGNLGIGVTPQEKVHVSNGNVRIGNPSASSYMLGVEGVVSTNSYYESLGTVIIKDSRSNSVITQSDSATATNRTLTIGNTTYSDIILAGNTNSLYVTNNGIGINQANPTNALVFDNPSGSNLITVRDITTAVRVGIGVTGSVSNGLELGDYSDRTLAGVNTVSFQGGEITANTALCMYFQTTTGYFFYPEGATPGSTPYGMVIRHLRDSATNTADLVLDLENSSQNTIFSVDAEGDTNINGSLNVFGGNVTVEENNILLSSGYDIREADNNSSIKFFDTVGTNGIEIYANSTLQLAFTNAGAAKFTGEISTTSNITGGKLLSTSMANIASDTDRFLMLDGTEIKYAGGAEVLTYLGGPASSTGTAGLIPLWQASNVLGDSIMFADDSQVAVNRTSVGDTSAKFQIDATDAGFLPPRMTETQKDAISTPATGLIVYQTDGTEGLYIYKSTGWTQII